MIIASNAIRWLEHLVLIILLIVVLALVAPFGKVSGANAVPAVSSEVVADAPGLSADMVSLLPDIATIYETAVTYPYEKARESITDPELLSFYDGYLKAAELS